MNLEFKFSYPEVDKYAAEMAIKLPQNSNLLTQMVTAETPIPKGELFSISLILISGLIFTIVSKFIASKPTILLKVF